MKNINFKSVGIFTLSVLLLTLLASCTLEQKNDLQNSLNIENGISEEESSIEIISEEEKNEVIPNEEKIINEVSVEENSSLNNGIYTDYSSELLANSQNDVILQFHADWCPSCISLNKNLESSSIPDGITILKVNYDTSIDLKQKYGVTMQHTSVLVKPNGEMIKKWSGSKNLEDLISEIN